MKRLNPMVMVKGAIRVCLTGVLLLMSVGPTAAATPRDAYADSVVEFQANGTNNVHRDANFVLGSPCKGTDQDLSLGGGWVVVDLGALEAVVDGQGNDLKVYESEDSPHCNGGQASPYEVFVSRSPNGPWVSIGDGEGVSEFDLTLSGLPSARYIRVEDRSSSQPDNSSSTPGADISGFEALHLQDGCQIPFFSQVNDNWRTHPLRGTCSGWCVDPITGFVTIGRCGCTLTSAAMVFNAYGASTTPEQLSDCMGNMACPYNWPSSANCSQGNAKWISRPEFSWEVLDSQLNQYHRPVILGVHRKGNPDDTHWVVVVSGHGNDPSNYRIHDPAFKCGANILLSDRISQDYDFDYLALYDGQIPCESLTVEEPLCATRGRNPQPIATTATTANMETMPAPINQDLASSSIISGTIWLYTSSAITMTVEITAASTAGNVTQMLVWSDSVTNTTWQPFTPFIWLPVGDAVFVRFQDGVGNTSDVYSDTVLRQGPPTAAYFEVYIPFVRR